MSTTPSDAPTSDIELFSDEALAEPYELYRQLRDLGPVVHLPAYDIYAIPRYAALRTVSKNWETFTSTAGVTLNDQMNRATEGILICSDPPEHRLMRKVLARPLRGQRLHSVRPLLEQEARAVVGRLVRRGSFEAVTELAQHLPVTVVSKLVGLGSFGREHMLEWAAAAFDAHGPDNARTRAAMPKVAELVDFAMHEATPENLDPDGWAAALYTAEAHGELQAGRCPFMMVDYIGPSLDTTIHGTSSAIWLFARHPEQWELMRQDPSLVRHAIDEVLRFESPIPRFTRVATRDYQIDGVTIPAGSRVMLLYGSANRDERRYECADRFDVTRRPSDHVAFGHGEHTCVGLNLARLEMQLVLDELVRTVERFELISYERALNSNLRGLARLEVRVHAA
ncbi:cytochrome P450 [Pseudonocardia kujensis]|uniref:cytochrome P450 n=1 Tax=Pseudonocardia kujensis TaxID=1128675 RepID=UPI001E44EFB8|nr:cytochrome P450 [Pseudonocardia kujensis]MCE0763299.1 cytochrome P450 [Pseudonocardia kujensis]